MLVLTRRTSESIRINDDIVIKVIRTHKGCVKIGVDAPPDVSVLRGELAERNDVLPIRDHAPRRGGRRVLEVFLRK